MGAIEPGERLEAEFRRIHRRLRWIALWTGAGWCTAAGIGLVLLIGMFDWSFHIEQPRTRQAIVIGSSVLWGLLLVLRVILPAVRRPNSTETARRIEQWRPHWRGALISSVEFLAARCPPESGAPALQSSLIARTQELLGAADIEPLMRVRGLRVATAAAVLLAVAAAAVAIADPASAGLALARMLAPASSPSWPRQHTLVLLDASFQPLDPQHPARPGAVGERLRLYVDDVGAGLPDDVSLQIATPDGDRRDQPLERTVIAGSDGRRRAIGVAALPAGSPSLRVRATGGDDNRMPWHTFEFVSRPTVRRFKVQLTPPEYTGQPAGEVIASSGELAALVGSRVHIDAELSMPVRDADFRQTGLPPTASRLSPDGLLFTVEFPIPAASGGAYSIGLLSRDGLRNADAAEYRVEGIADREPAVALSQPAVDLSVTPEAVLPLRIEAGDDLGLVYVRLSMAEPPGSAGEQLRSLPLESPLAREAQIDTQLAIEGSGLEPGRRLVLRAEAADAFNLDGRHIVRSVPRTLTIVSAAEKLSELVSRQSMIADMLQQAEERQVRALQQTRQLQLQWQTASQLSMNDIESLRRMAQDQSQITSALDDDEQGGLPQVRRILEEFAWNRLEDNATVDRLSHLQQELERLKSEIVPTLDHAVSLAVRMAGSSAGDAMGPFGNVLSDVESQQATAHELLAALAEQFSQWQRRHDLTRSVAEFVAEQGQLNRETRETGRRTLTSPLADLPADDRAGLARIAQRQEQVADRLQQLEKRLQDAAAQSATDEAENRLPTVDVGRALAVLEEAAVGVQMQRAAQLIARNSIADSAAIQQSIVESLARLEEAVRGLNSGAPETLLRKVERAEVEAESLQLRQEQLRDDAHRNSSNAASSAADSLRVQQQGLADETSDWAQRLRREQLGDAATSAGDASDAMMSAAARIGEDDITKALAVQQAAIEQLQAARRRLAAQRRELEFDQTISQWSRVTALLEAFSERQVGLLTETVRLNAEQSSKDGLSRSQLRTVLTLGAAQGQLADDVDLLGTSPDGSAVIREALVVPVERMRTAAQRLSEPRVDDAVRAAQQEAVDRLRALLDDLQVGTPSAHADTNAEAAAGEDGPAPANWPLASQLKVLARLQRDVSRRAAAIVAALPADQTPNQEQQDELRQLAEQQGRLAEVLQQLFNGGEELEAVE